MTISSAVNSQISANIASQAKKSAEATQDERAGTKTGAKAQSSSAENPAVVVDAASGQAAAAGEKLASVEIGSATEASRTAQSIGAELSQQNTAIANQSTAAVAGLLSELEAAQG